MELFNLYVQVLLSQAIDPTFFATIEQGQGLCLMSFMLQLAASSLIHSLHSYCKFGEYISTQLLVCNAARNL